MVVLAGCIRVRAIHLTCDTHFPRRTSNPKYLSKNKSLVGFVLTMAVVALVMPVPVPGKKLKSSITAPAIYLNNRLDNASIEPNAPFD
jgi:hypothetical protein